MWAALIPWTTVQSDAPSNRTPTYDELQKGMDLAIVLIAQMEAQLEDNERVIKALKTALAVDRNCA